MAAVISILTLALVSLVVTRIATVALTLTGLSRESARFQARSALTGAGFTTSESELVVGHPVRRRIILALMLLGSVGLVSLIATLSATFVETDGILAFGGTGLGVVVGLAVLYLMASSSMFDRALRPVIAFVLRRVPDLEVRDYASLLQVHGDYAVMELKVNPGDWLADKSLIDLRLPDEGIIVLGVLRDDEVYVGAPEGTTVIQTGETLVVYGQRQRLQELDDRPDGEEGDRAHERATREQDAVEAVQDPVASRDTLVERAARRARRAATVIPGVTQGEQGLRIRRRKANAGPIEPGGADVVGDEAEGPGPPDDA